MKHGEPTSQRELSEAKAYARSRTAMKRAEERDLFGVIAELQEEVDRLRQREESAREFVKRHPALSLIDLAEFEAFLKIPEAIAAATPSQA